MGINSHYDDFEYEPPQDGDGYEQLETLWQTFYKISRELYLPGFNAETDNCMSDDNCDGVIKTVDENGTPVTAYVLPSASYSKKHTYTPPLLSTPSYIRIMGKNYGQAMINYYTGNLLKNSDKGEKFKEQIKKHWAIERYLYRKNHNKLHRKYV